MKFVIFGLSISSSWGNGHATLWRGLCRALARRRHSIVFFEKDVLYYASTRDLWDLPCTRLELYRTWEDVFPLARRELAGADVAIATSYCPDAIAASALLLDANIRLRVFYDLGSRSRWIASGRASRWNISVRMVCAISTLFSVTPADRRWMN